MQTSDLAPGVPRDYYARIRAFEDRHWWYRGMRSIGDSLLEAHGPVGPRILDAGCGTGGFLLHAQGRWAPSRLAGADLAEAAIEIARGRVPGAELEVAPLCSLPFEDASFDLVVTQDVLQHVHEAELGSSVAELRRVLSPSGTLLVRVNGSRRLRRERDDWRAFDALTLRRTLTEAGLGVERITHANSLLSLWGELRGKVPHAPTIERDGIPTANPSAVKNVIGLGLLALEARYLGQPGRTLPFGHNLFVLATPA